MIDRDQFHYDESAVPEGYIMVRGLAVPKDQLDAVEQMYGAKYIDETTLQNRVLIQRLDDELARFVKANEGMEPEFITFVDIPHTYFKHMPINHNLAGFNVPINTKPAWFQFKRVYSGVNLTQ